MQLAKDFAFLRQWIEGSQQLTEDSKRYKYVSLGKSRKKTFSSRYLLLLDSIRQCEGVACLLQNSYGKDVSVKPARGNNKVQDYFLSTFYILLPRWLLARSRWRTLPPWPRFLRPSRPSCMSPTTSSGSASEWGAGVAAVGAWECHFVAKIGISIVIKMIIGHCNNFICLTGIVQRKTTNLYSLIVRKNT